MSIILLITAAISLIIYLYGIWLRYLWILPIILFIGIFFYYSASKNINLKEDSFLQKNSLLVVRMIIVGWLLGTLITLWVDINSTRWILIITNFLLWVGSYFFDYEDGKAIFQWWLYFTLASLLIYLAFSASSINSFIKITSNISILTTIILWVIPIVIGIKNKSEKTLYYKTALSGLISLILIIINLNLNPYISIIISLWIITSILIFIQKNINHKPILTTNNEEISVRRILAWERISNQKKHIKKNNNAKIVEFLQDTPMFFKIWLEILNISILWYFITQFIWWINNAELINQIFYRSIFILIITNILMLKKISYNSLIQNFIFFIIINFSIYISLFSIFKNNIWEIVTRWIMRNVLSTLCMFYIHKVSFFSKTINKLDYYYRIICAIIWMIINLILLIKTSLPWELIFFLFLLYLGIQWMILFYVIKFISKLEFQKEENNLI